MVLQNPDEEYDQYKAEFDFIMAPMDDIVSDDEDADKSYRPNEKLKTHKLEMVADESQNERERIVLTFLLLFFYKKKIIFPKK